MYVCMYVCMYVTMILPLHFSVPIYSGTYRVPLIDPSFYCHPFLCKRLSYLKQLCLNVWVHPDFFV